MSNNTAGVVQAKGKIIPLTVNGSATSAPIKWQGGAGAYTCEATWGGGTVTFQFKSGNGTWIAVGTDTTLTANGAAGFYLPPCDIRVLVATATLVCAYVVPM